jgi:hypothetical protein
MLQVLKHEVSNFVCLLDTIGDGRMSLFEIINSMHHLLKVGVIKQELVVYRVVFIYILKFSAHFRNQLK